MRILVLGADGYLGWPTAMHLSARGHEVTVVDNYLKRQLAHQTHSESLLPTPNLQTRAQEFHAATGHRINVRIGDVTSFRFLGGVFGEVEPEAAIHYAEQPSGPFSMRDYDSAKLTLENNLGSTLALIWAAKERGTHIIKLGTMGEWGTPDTDIPEGFAELEYNGRTDTFLFPRQAGSMYHTCKILETDLLWFYVRMYGLRVTDLMQGPVYGISTDETDLDPRLGTDLFYDDIFGTALNRFCVQAVAGVPLTVYGQGGQTRGYLNIRDTVRCVELACTNPADSGELRVMNQFTETFSVNDLAERVREAAAGLKLKVTIEHLPNPRIEAEEHYYNPDHDKLLSLGLEPHYLTPEVLHGMLLKINDQRDRIDPSKIQPRVRWTG